MKNEEFISTLRDHHKAKTEYNVSIKTGVKPSVIIRSKKTDELLYSAHASKKPMETIL